MNGDWLATEVAQACFLYRRTVEDDGAISERLVGSVEPQKDGTFTVTHDGRILSEGLTRKQALKRIFTIRIMEQVR